MYPTRPPFMIHAPGGMSCAYYYYLVHLSSEVIKYQVTKENKRTCCVILIKHQTHNLHPEHTETESRIEQSNNHFIKGQENGSSTPLAHLHNNLLQLTWTIHDETEAHWAIPVQTPPTDLSASPPTSASAAACSDLRLLVIVAMIESLMDPLWKGDWIEKIIRGGLYFERLANWGLKDVRRGNSMSNIEISPRRWPDWAPGLKTVHGLGKRRGSIYNQIELTSKAEQTQIMKWGWRGLVLVER